MPLLRLFFAFSLAALLTGCCSFTPCHFGTKIVGSVTDVNGEPITGAQGSLYGRKFISKAGGCISIEAPDALPFTLAFTAQGYVPIEVPAKPGFYIVRVKLAPAGSTLSGQVVSEELTEREYRAVLNKKCP